MDESNQRAGGDAYACEESGIHEIPAFSGLSARPGRRGQSARPHGEPYSLGRIPVEVSFQEQLIAALIHDVRAPLAAAAARAEQIRRHPHDEASVRALACRIVANLERVERMLREALDVTRERSLLGPILCFEDLDLVQLVHDVVHEASVVHGERFVVAAEEPIRGIFDREAMRRALWNLISNAVKYGEANAPVTILVRREGGGAAIAVHNFGAVIPVSEHARLFDPFYRASGASPGWGLGLVTVRACAESHGGTVTIESTVTAGTTFTIHVALDPRRAHPPAGHTPNADFAMDR